MPQSPIFDPNSGVKVNALPIGKGFYELAGLSANSNVDLLPSTDVSTYNVVSIAITGTFSAQINFWGSNDGLTWENVYLTNIETKGDVQFSTITGIFVGNILYRFFKTTVTNYASGTVNSTVEFYTDDLITKQTDVTPNVYKTVIATASGNTALWTPTSGKRFQLMRYIMDATEDITTSVAGDITISFQDATTPLNIAVDVFVPSTASPNAGAAYSSGWVDLGTGILSAAINNVLNVNLSAALTSGRVRVNVAGIEV